MRSVDGYSVTQGEYSITAQERVCYHTYQRRSPYSLSQPIHYPHLHRKSTRAGCNKCASADNPTRRQATTDKS